MRDIRIESSPQVWYMYLLTKTNKLSQSFIFSLLVYIDTLTIYAIVDHFNML